MASNKESRRRLQLDEAELEKVRKAVRTGDCSAVVEYVNQGWDVDQALSWRDDTALLYAAELGQTEVARVLCKAGANVNKRDRGGWTPLHCAAWCGHTQTVKCLVEHNSTVDARDQGGWTPLHCAACCGHTQTVKCLVEHNAIVDGCDKDGDTPVHIASQRGQAAVVELLVHEGSYDVTAVNKNGETAYDVCGRYCSVFFDKTPAENIKTLKGFLEIQMKQRQENQRASSAEGAEAKDRSSADPHLRLERSLAHYLESSGAKVSEGGVDINIRAQREGKSEIGILGVDVRRSDYFPVQSSRKEPTHCSFGPAFDWNKETMSAHFHTSLSTAFKSVALIVGQTGTGSGFRVGPDYVMTNKHVAEQLGDDLRNSAVLFYYDKPSLLGLGPAAGSCVESLVYSNDDLDVAVLKLDLQTDLPLSVSGCKKLDSLPPPLTRFKKLIKETQLHFAGHPDGKNKVADVRCSVVQMEPSDFRKTHDELKQWSQAKFGFDVFPKFGDGRRALYKTSSNFGKGSSGCPGFLPDEQHEASVAVMQTFLFPNVPPFHTVPFDEIAVRSVEQGIRMEAIYDDINISDNHLCSEIFPNGRPQAAGCGDTQTVECVVQHTAAVDAPDQKTEEEKISKDLEIKKSQGHFKVVKASLTGEISGSDLSETESVQSTESGNSTLTTSGSVTEATGTPFGDKDGITSPLNRMWIQTTSEDPEKTEQEQILKGCGLAKSQGHSKFVKASLTAIETPEDVQFELVEVDQPLLMNHCKDELEAGLLYLLPKRICVNHFDPKRTRSPATIRVNVSSILQQMEAKTPDFDTSCFFILRKSKSDVTDITRESQPKLQGNHLVYFCQHFCEHTVGVTKYQRIKEKIRLFIKGTFRAKLCPLVTEAVYGLDLRLFCHTICARNYLPHPCDHSRYPSELHWSSTVKFEVSWSTKEGSEKTKSSSALPVDLEAWDDKGICIEERATEIKEILGPSITMKVFSILSKKEVTLFSHIVEIKDNARKLKVGDVAATPFSLTTSSEPSSCNPSLAMETKGARSGDADDTISLLNRMSIPTSTENPKNKPHGRKETGEKSATDVDVTPWTLGARSKYTRYTPYLVKETTGAQLGHRDDIPSRLVNKRPFQPSTEDPNMKHHERKETGTLGQPKEIHQHLLLVVAENLEIRDFERLKGLCKCWVTPATLEEIKNPQKLLDQLEKQAIIRVGEYSKLIGLLSLLDLNTLKDNVERMSRKINALGVDLTGTEANI